MDPLNVFINVSHKSIMIYEKTEEHTETAKRVWHKPEICRMSKLPIQIGWWIGFFFVELDQSV